MQLVVHMEYLAKDSKSGRYRYRRRVPGDLTKLIGKQEFSVSLKTKDQRVALDRYKTVHGEVEAEIEAARAIDPADAGHKSALQTLRKYGLVSPLEKSLAHVSSHADPEFFNKLLIQRWMRPIMSLGKLLNRSFLDYKSHLFVCERPPLLS